MDHVPRLRIRELEKVMARIEEQRRTPTVLALDTLLNNLVASALTDSERSFLDDLQRRAKSRVAKTHLDSAIDDVIREILEELQWALLRGSADEWQPPVE